MLQKVSKEPCIEAFWQEAEELDRIFRSVKYTPQLLTDRAFLNAISSLRHLIRTPAYEGVAEDIVRSHRFQEKVLRWRTMYQCYETWLETQSCIQILQEAAKSSVDGLRRSQADWKQEIAMTAQGAVEEARVTGVTDTSRIAFIGSGPFPESAIALARTYGCRVDCFDHSPEAVLLSSQLVAVLGLADKIEVNYQEATTVSFSTYTHIFVAVLAEPKRQILEQIAKTASSTTQVICRTVSGLRQSIYQSANEVVSEYFEITNKIEDLERTCHYALVLKRGRPVSG